MQELEDLLMQASRVAENIGHAKPSRLVINILTQLTKQFDITESVPDIKLDNVKQKISTLKSMISTLVSKPPSATPDH